MANGNLLFGQSRKTMFEEMADEMKCSNYQPCPVCFKCLNRAVHLYERCSKCDIPLCGHRQKDRQNLIRPKNFTLAKTDDLADDIQREYDNYRREHK